MGVGAGQPRVVNTTISTKVNNPINDVAACIEPFQESGGPPRANRNTLTPSNCDRG
jgi:hypothetical protein